MVKAISRCLHQPGFSEAAQQLANGLVRLQIDQAAKPRSRRTTRAAAGHNQAGDCAAQTYRPHARRSYAQRPACQVADQQRGTRSGTSTDSFGAKQILVDRFLPAILMLRKAREKWLWSENAARARPHCGLDHSEASLAARSPVAALPALQILRCYKGAWPLPSLVSASVGPGTLAVVKRLADSERHATAALIRSLMELDARRLYLQEGFPSMFVYCTHALSCRSMRVQPHRGRARRPPASAAARCTGDGDITVTTARLLGPI